MIIIDGAMGEGGGQVFRSALTLSIITGEPVTIDNIRAGRRKPGLLRQHLTALKAAVTICDGVVAGDDIGSQSVTFTPGAVRAGEYSFAIGTAGSCSLVMQTIALPLALASEPSKITIEGGTHNPHAPPFDFLTKSFLPLLLKMGVEVTATLDRPGFYPAGGGKISIEVFPVKTLRPLTLESRGAIKKITAEALVARLPLDIAHREMRRVGSLLSLPDDAVEIREVSDSVGPGNVMSVTVESNSHTENFSGFGEIGLSAERVAKGVVNQVRSYLTAGTPVGKHLADQLLLPMVVAGGGRFVTGRLSKHTTTNISVIEKFRVIPIALEESQLGKFTISLGDRAEDSSE